MPATASKADVYQIITDRVIQMLDKGVIPWRQPWKNVGAPRNLVSKKEYRGINVFLLSAMGFKSPYWVSFKQAQQLGGRVKAGERGFPCVFWKFWKQEETTPTGEKKEVRRMILRYYTVFNVEQTTGLEAKIPQPEVLRDSKPIEACESLVRGMPSRPNIVHGIDRACYNLVRDNVTMPDRENFISDEHYYSVLFHELTHSTGAKARLGRHKDAITQMELQTYSQEELVAEMGAAYLCGVAGIENATIEDSASYISHWAAKLKDDRKMIVMAAAQAQKAADYIQGITRDEEKDEKDGEE